MAQVINGITVNELVEAFGESFDLTQGPQARKAYLCNWTDRYTVANGLLGLSNTTHVGGLISLITPRQYEERSTMYAHTIEIRGVGTPTQGTSQIRWAQAILTVTYQCLPWSFSGVDYMQLSPTNPYIYAEQNMSFGMEFITVPGSKVKYATSGKPLDEPWGFASPKLDMQITLKYVPYLPAQQILAALQAPINSATYLGVAPGFLLFNGAENHQTRMTDGTFTQDITYSFSYRPIAPWDYTYDGTNNRWDQVVSLSGANIINRSDLSVIIPSDYA
jgi:hypothetical protein